VRSKLSHPFQRSNKMAVWNRSVSVFGARATRSKVQARSRQVSLLIRVAGLRVVQAILQHATNVVDVMGVP
jgi:hypothetical protein